MNEVTLILGMTAVTFGVRYLVLAFFSKVEMPRPLFRALRFVPPVVLSAIIFPAVLLKDSRLNIALDNAALAASLVAALVSWRTKNLLLTIVIGMAAFLLWRGLM